MLRAGQRTRDMARASPLIGCRGPIEGARFSGLLDERGAPDVTQMHFDLALWIDCEERG